MYNLLLVDDEAIIRKGIISSIDWRKLNIEPYEAKNGLEAYEMIIEQRYDIILVDIKMPGLNGLELIEKVKVSFPDAMFIILSGYAEFALASQAMKYGVKHYLLKPADKGEITSTLETVINEIRNRTISPNNMILLFNKIEEYIKNGNGVGLKSVVDNFFEILQQCKQEEEICRNYCMELLVRILRECVDPEYISRCLKISSEIEKSETIEVIYRLILEVGSEVIEINKNEVINTQRYSDVIQAALKYIKENISNEELSLMVIANHLYMNSDYLGKLFKKEVGESFNQYLSTLRINKAKEMIENDSTCKISFIAESVGFGTNSQYFSQVFKKCTGYTPKQYKELFYKDI